MSKNKKKKLKKKQKRQAALLEKCIMDLEEMEEMEKVEEEEDDDDDEDPQSPKARACAPLRQLSLRDIGEEETAGRAGFIDQKISCKDLKCTIYSFVQSGDE